MSLYFPHIWKIFHHYSANIFLFLPLLPSGTLILYLLDCLILSHRSLIFISHFSPFASLWINIFKFLIISSSAVSSLLLIVFSTFFCFVLNFILFFYTAGSYQLSILYILVYICQSQSPNSSHPPPPHHSPRLVSIRLFCTSVSLFLPRKLVHLYHFSRFHIYVLIYDFLFLFLTYFTLYDSLQK